MTEKNSPKISQIIRAGREEAGHSRESLAKITKIHPRIIEAIEKDAWGKSLSLTNYKGFLKILSRELKISPDELLALVEKENRSQGGSPRKRIFLMPLISQKFNYFYYFLIVILTLFFLHWLSRLLAKFFWFQGF